MTVTTSATWNTTSMSCSISITAWSTASARSRSARRPLSSGPMPASGSSRSSTEGPPASAIAISRPRSWPWLRVAAVRPATGPSPTRSRAASAACRRAGSAAARRKARRPGVSRACAASRTFSSTVMVRMTLVRWNERPIPARARRQDGQPATSAPCRCRRPPVGGSSPASRLVRVDLPAPFGPITACNSPTFSAMSTASTATRAPKRRVSPSATRTDGVSARAGFGVTMPSPRQGPGPAPGPDAAGARAASGRSGRGAAR